MPPRMTTQPSQLRDHLSEVVTAGIARLLSRGTQYWMRVRPMRGSGTEKWSDRAARLALGKRSAER